MDTYCKRSFDWYLVDLDRLHWKMCCLTKWNSMDLGQDWFNGDHMRQRRNDHLQGRKHSDCTHCWSMEERGLLSPRNLDPQPAIMPTSLDPHRPALLEITMGNTCDLACRYCHAEYSSKWSERLADASHRKQSRSSAKTEERYQAVMPQFQAWLDRELDGLHSVWFTGGEVLLMDSFYALLERTDFKNITIGISTNLNTPDAYLQRIIRSLDDLVSRGNKVMFRVSMDGIGAKNDWQRQGSSWARMQQNWFTLGTLPGVVMGVGYTVTPLTLEGMLEVGRFVRDSKPQLSNQPNWYPINHVTWPSALDPAEWIGAFAEDLQELNNLIKQNDWAVTNDSATTLLDDWSSRSYSLPSVEQASKLVEWLDDSAARWGGGDWRPIYPRVSEIADKAMNS